MAFSGTVTLLTSGVSDVSQSSRSIAPVDPTPGRILMAACVARETTGSSPAPNLSISASGGTWSFTEFTVSNTAQNRATLSVWAAVIPVDASSATVLTFTPDETCNRWEWAVWEVSGGALPAGDSITGVSTSATPSITLGTSPAANSVVFGIVASVAKNGAVTPGAGFTELVDTANGNQTTLQVQYDPTSPGTGVSWSDCGTTSNLMVAIELESSAAVSADRALRFKASNTSDTLQAVERTIPAAETGRWHSFIVYLDTSGGIVGIYAADGTGGGAAFSGTAKTQSGDFIIGNAAPSATQSIDVLLGTVVPLDYAPLTAADRNQTFSLLAEDLAPVVTDMAATISANATSSVSLAGAIKDPSLWGYTVSASANDDGCEVAVVGTSLSVTSNREGASGITVTVTNLYPRPRSRSFQIALTMSLVATGSARGLSGFSPAGSGGPSSTINGDNQYANLLVLDTNLKSGTKSKVLVHWPGVGSVGGLSSTGWSTGLMPLLKDYGCAVSVSVPLCFTTKWDGGNGAGDFQGVIDGRYDNGFRNMCTKWKNIGVTDGIFRIGWEMNLKGSFPHAISRDFIGIGNAQNFAKYKAAFNHVASLIKNELPECRIDWCNFKEGKFQRSGGAWYYPHPDEYYPGATYIDIISVDWYDGDGSPVTLSNYVSRFAAKKNVGSTATNMGASNAANPFGPDSWYDYAKSKGKLFAIPEWGIHSNGDNPDFIQAMKTRFDGRWSDILDYECYFHRGGSPQGSHRLWPNTLDGTKNATNKYIDLYD